MKVAILVALFAAAQAGPILAPLSSGQSTVSRSEDGAGNYAFSYNEDHATGGSFRSEQGAPGAVTGSYGLRDADGRVRTVNYIADAQGFRASISTNEPGVEPKPAADTSINAVLAAAPLIAAAAPVVHAPAPLLAAPAPVLAAAPSGIAYSSSVNHAAPARLHFAHAPAAPLVAPWAAPVHAPVARIAQPWGYTAQW